MSARSYPAYSAPAIIMVSPSSWLPMRRGFLYLVAIMDWATRKVLGWRISNTLEADFCVEALDEAILRFGPPEIMNTGQGCRFTSFAWIDNIFIERLWRSLRYERVSRHARETGSQAKAGIGRWISFYNHQRPHAAHGGRTPAVLYWSTVTQTDQPARRVA